ncbi:hypothetical protein A3F66_00495 [candidate division TM6 bacterium RIFCSPHIGHO2_12_FULL_32_22]|nr:MAG: hypothetical protein A3F66_00495 [candidate division TM6 bacterium RIFCSPHIGHO2_12_FULL_32_22]
MKKSLIIFLINSINIQCADDQTTFLVSNGGQGGNSNEIAFYNFLNYKTSTLIAGYNSRESDNGHCAKAITGPGSRVSLVIPEKLGKSGRISDDCIVSPGTYDVELSKCATAISVPVVKKGKSKDTSNQTEEYKLNKVMCGAYVENNKTIQVPDDSGKKQNLTIYVSDVCCSLALDFINNFAVDKNGKAINLTSCEDIPADANFKIGEFASCSPSATSYCAIEFAPKTQNSKLRINTDYLMFDGNYLPGVCSIGSALPGSQAQIDTEAVSVANNTGVQSYCNLMVENGEKISNVNYNFDVTGQSLNNWAINVFTPGNTTSDPGSTPPSATFNGAACTAVSYSTPESDPLVYYTCKTSGINPNYNCHFSYTVTTPGCFNNGDCAMQLTSAYCDIPISLFVQSPQKGDADFDCGFSSMAEIYTVGNNQINNPIESGDFPELAPFTTLNSPAPYSDGFVSDLSNQLDNLVHITEG